MALPLPIPNPSDDPRWSDTRRASEEPIGPMTFEEYLAYPGSGLGDELHEYVNGMLYRKFSGTAGHAIISTNLVVRLHTNARRSGCHVFTQAYAVRTPDDRGYLPDVMVRCGSEPSPDRPYTENPCLVVEVLSPSTRRVDLVKKADTYRGIPSVQAYWLVEATWRCVYRHWRDASGAWQFEEVTGDGAVPAPCPVETIFTLDEIYDGVDVPREPPRPSLCRVYEANAEYTFDAAPEAGADALPEYAD